ncbi:glycosyl transferase family 1 [Alkalihalobacillus alcalophilus ATCC 27647 = CGMCC 1.3604]|uniref:Glycosyl transferase family 1 n=1 Tax=Alkalihalobacillus alcalophilus ATCC 27647 = CGMCC 1.3604 TaxID=1218173 RepID=A0A094WKX0_ALKAL|nr:glycosyltransferase [Alkalihalobacillus alcalophilus]KGA98394.1 glycosyl transferase family 1 [Alkalihalobacillus alcalophilus ATCC 27647 = CGMCC 1.3604]MED1563930.1 glycosyltransferase [Alkalihalobacillus alcalophilus]THG91583.1 glycosyl transferase family 1 [Alkalihalobacillus alcalophilus ATCC 27647 = CGMCC 1.3604]
MKYEKRLKILILIKPFYEYLKHKPKWDMIQALEKIATVRYWHEDGHINEIIDFLKFEPDFILHYDIAWRNGLSPNITGLEDVNIPKGAYVIDLHWDPDKRIEYIRNNRIDLIFSPTKNPFLKVFPQFEEKLSWVPWAINQEVMKDWKQPKDIQSLLLGLVHTTSEEMQEKNVAVPKMIPPKGRYEFRDQVLKRMLGENGFVFHPHPGHRVTEEENNFVKEAYAKELNRAKIFYTCGSRNETGGIAVLKFFEALACNTLLLAETNEDIEELGFIDGKNFVACTVDDFYEKTMYYLTNKAERQAITANGYQFAHQNHTIEHRAVEMLEAIKKVVK